MCFISLGSISESINVSDGTIFDVIYRTRIKEVVGLLLVNTLVQ